MDNIGALWINVSTKNGKKFMVGNITINNITTKIIVFKNEKKNSDNQPDFNIVLKKENPETQQKSANEFEGF